MNHISNVAHADNLLTDRHPVARGTILLILAQVSTVLSGLVVHFVGSRILPYGAYAQFTLAISVVAVVQLSLTTGFPKTFAFLVSRNPEKAWYLAKRGSVVVLLLSFVIVILCSAACLWFGDGHVNGAKGVLLIAVAGLPPTVTFFALLGIVNGLGMFAWESLAMSTYYLGRGMLISVLLISTISVHWGISGNLFAGVAASALAFYIVRSRSLNVGPHCDLNLTKAVRAFGLPVTVYGVLMSAMMSLDLWIANTVVKDSAALAGFSCAHTISRVFIYGAMGLSRAIFPPLVAALETGNHQKVNDIVSKSILMIEFSVLPLTAATYLFPEVAIMALYPKDYGGASASLGYLGGARLCVSFILILTTMLMAAKRMTECVMYGVAGCLVTAIGAFLGSTYHQEAGLAAGYFVSCFLVLVVAVIRICPEGVHRVFTGRNLSCLVLASALGASLAWASGRLMTGDPSLVVQMIGFASIVVIYPATAFVLGVLRGDDFDFIRHMLRSSR